MQFQTTPASDVNTNVDNNSSDSRVKLSNDEELVLRYISRAGNISLSGAPIFDNEDDFDVVLASLLQQRFVTTMPDMTVVLTESGKKSISSNMAVVYPASATASNYKDVVSTQTGPAASAFAFSIANDPEWVDKLSAKAYNALVTKMLTRSNGLYGGTLRMQAIKSVEELNNRGLRMSLAHVLDFYETLLTSVQQGMDTKISSYVEEDEIPLQPTPYEVEGICSGRVITSISAENGYPMVTVEDEVTGEKTKIEMASLPISLVVSVSSQLHS